MIKYNGMEVLNPNVEFEIRNNELLIKLDIPEQNFNMLEFNAPIFKNGELNPDGWLIQLEKRGNVYAFSVGGEYLGDIQTEEIIPSLKEVLTIL